MHAQLIELLRLGLSYSEARELAYEDALCLLWHLQHESYMRFIDQETLRIASMPLAEPREQSLVLCRLQQRARAAQARFERSYPGNQA